MPEKQINIAKLVAKKSDDQVPYMFLACLFTFFAALLCFIPFQQLKRDEYFFYLVFFIMSAFAIEFYTTPYIMVREQGKAIWVFDKFTLMPTTRKLMFQAIRTILTKFSTILLLICQAIQLFTVLIIFKKPLGFAAFLPAVTVAFQCAYKLLRVYMYRKKN